MPERTIIARSAFVIMVAASLTLFAAGCQRASRTDNASQTPDVTIAFAVAPDPALVGQAETTVTLTGDDGQPITGAQVQIKGDMSHAGMEPALAEATEISPGLYRAGITWTMSGDWIVTVRAALTDGRVAERSFDLSVSR